LSITYNPFLPAVRLNPYPVYRDLRATDPVHYSPAAGIWFLTRHEHCAFVLRDRAFSAELGQRLRRREDALPRSMLNSDPPEHDRLRRPVGRELKRWFARSRPRIEGLVDDLLTALARRAEPELMTDFAVPLGHLLIATMLGIPERDLERFRAWATDASVHLDPLAPPERLRVGGIAAAELSEYFSRLIVERTRQPGGDFLSGLASLVRTTGKLSHDEVVATCGLIVVGGCDPTAHLVGNGVLALLEHPRELARLQREPAMAATAVEELLRFDSPIQFAARLATSDVRVGDKLIQRGAAVVALIGAANRDPSVFPRSDDLDLGRAPNPHLAFGSGAHACLGAPLVRLGGQLALDGLLRRFPTLRLGSEPPRWRASLVPRGLAALGVAW